MSPVPVTAAALPAELEALMRQLKLPHARALAPELIATAHAQRWEPAAAIKALFVEEVAGRSRSMLETRRKAAGFPTGKTFDIWDPAASSIPAPTQQALRTLEWIGRKENVAICGPSGTGKTFFLEVLDQQAVEAGLLAAWFRLEDLGALMRAHRSDDSVTKVVARILRADLVVVDVIGLLPVGTDAAEGLYRLVDAAYEKRSIAVSSNLHPAGFDELMPKTLATATVDRLLHHANLWPDLRGFNPSQPGPGRKRSHTNGLKESRAWPKPPNTLVGRSLGHEWAVFMATSGHLCWPPVGRNFWPLTLPRKTARTGRMFSG